MIFYLEKKVFNTKKISRNLKNIILFRNTKKISKKWNLKYMVLSLFNYKEI